MPKRSVIRQDHRRAEIANEAARIMHEQGLSDFRIAKEKALERLGLHVGRSALPSNSEIDRALAERNRIFHSGFHDEHLLSLRRAALNMMEWLAAHSPRLVGPVLSGTVTEHSAIDLHLFSDAPESIGASLDSLGIRYRSVQRRTRVRRDQVERFPGYRFCHSGFDFAGVVFPERRRSHAPLSPVDGKPMRRADSQQILSLLGESIA